MKSPVEKNNQPAVNPSKSFFDKGPDDTFFSTGTQKTGSFFNSNPIQAKLTVGRQHDKYEKEADTIADQVVQKPATTDISPTPVQTKCATCDQEERVSEEEGKEEKLQAKSEGGIVPSAASGVENSLSVSQGSGAALPVQNREQMESSFGADFSGVRVHTNGNAAQMNNELNAKAFTYGNDIYFNSGEFDTDSTEGNHLLAHELTHVIQQKGGDKQIARQTADDLHGSSAEIPSPDKHILYDEYVKMYATQITGLLGLALSKNNYVVPVPHVSWRNGSSEKFAIDLWSPVWADKKNIFTILTDIIAPDPLMVPINAGRDSVSAEGTDVWKQGVILELDRFVSRRLIMALKRVVPKYALIMNHKQLKNEQDKTTISIEPAAQELFATHPIEKYIIPALNGKLAIDFTEYRKMFEEGYPALPKGGPLRAVEIEFQAKQGAPNWIKVIKPVDASKEEVANELYGTETKSWAISGVTPYYALPLRGPGREDMYRFLPKYEAPYQEILRNYKTDPVQQNIHTGGFVVIMPGSLPEPMTGGKIADDIALSQATTIKGSGAGRSEILQRIRLITHILDNAIKIYEKDPGQSGKVPWLLTIYEEIDRRFYRLNGATDQEVLQWDAQTVGQLFLITSAYEGMLMAKKQAEVFKDFPKVTAYAGGLGFDYADVIRNSGYYQTGKEALDWANDQSLLFPIMVMEDILADVRRTIESVRQDKTKNNDPKIRERVYATKMLDKQEMEIRQKLITARSILLQEPDKIKELLTDVYKQLQEIQVGAELVADMDAVDAVWRELYDALSFSGEIRAIWGGGNAILSKAMESNRELWSQWTAIYIRWKSGDKKEKEQAQKDLLDKSKTDEWKGYFRDVAAIIEDHKLIDKWMNLALMVGIAIFTAGLGAYVEVYLGTAWGVANLTGRAALTSWRVWAASGIAVTTEAAVFTTLSTAVLEKDPTLSGFLKSFGENILLFGGLKAISKTYGAVLGAEKAATVAGKIGNIATQFTAVNAYALMKANKEKHDKLGKSLSWDEIMDISFQNLAFLVAVAIGGKLAESPMQKIIVRGKLEAGAFAVRRAEQRLEDISKKVETSGGKDEKLNREFEKRNDDLLKAQDNFLSDLLKIALNPKLAKAAGISEEVTKDLRASLEGVQTALVLSHLDPIATDEFLANTETFDKAKELYSRQKDTKVEESLHDPYTNMRRLKVTTPEKTFTITERVSETKQDIVQEPKEVTEPLPGVKDAVEPVKPKLTFEERLNELLKLNTEAQRPPYLDHSIRRLRDLKIPEDTILALVRNGFLHSDRSPTIFFSNLNSFAASEVGKDALLIVVEGLASDKNFYTARFLMERASWNQAAQVRQILSVLNLEEVGRLRMRFSGGSDSSFTNKINTLTSSINAPKETIFQLLDEAGMNEAALDSLTEAIERLGNEKYTPAQIRDSLSFDQQLKQAIANKSKTEEIAKLIFGDKFKGQEGDTYKVSESLTKNKAGDQAASFIFKRASIIANIVLGDVGTNINEVNWGVIRDIVEKTDLPTVVKNGIIGELWASVKVRQYTRMGYTVIREVHVRWQLEDGNWSKKFAKIDAVLKKGNLVLYREFKASATADTSGAQDAVYEFLNTGQKDKLQPFGERAVEAFGGPNMPDFAAGTVEIERPKDK